MMQYQLRFDFAVLSFSLLFNFSQSLICTNGGYCTDDADCVPGNFCRFSENYSQCQINPDQGACLAIYATCGGIGQSYSSVENCCPGTTCTYINAYFSQCLSANYNCTFPSGYATKSVSPVKKSTFAPQIDSHPRTPRQLPTVHSTLNPSHYPSVRTSSKSPTFHLSSRPSTKPSFRPSYKPSFHPTGVSSIRPTLSIRPSIRPTPKPSLRSSTSTNIPSNCPSKLSSHPTTSKSPQRPSSFSPSIIPTTKTKTSLPNPRPFFIPTTSPPTTIPTELPSPFDINSPLAPSAVPYLLPTVNPASPFEISYHGGSVMATYPTHFYNIYIGNSFSEDTISSVNYFASNLGNTAWFNVLSSYYEIDSEANIVPVSNISQFQQFIQVPPPNNSGNLRDSDIQNLIFQLILNNSVIELDSNAVYTVFFDGQLNATSADGRTWPSDWCSYHSSFQLSSFDVLKYAVVGDPTTAAGHLCKPSVLTAVGRTSPADFLILQFAKQVAQSITNYNFAAWFSDSNGHLEVASACDNNFGDHFNVIKNTSNIIVGNRTFLIQSLWERGAGCTMELV